MLTKQERLTKLDAHILTMCDRIDEAIDLACDSGYDENVSEVHELTDKLDRLRNLRYLVESILTPAEEAADEAELKALQDAAFNKLQETS